MKRFKIYSIVETVIILSILIALLSLPFLAYRINDFENGDHFANMLAPTLSLVGSMLVYFAFKAQIKANDTIQQQFVKQNFDQNFFRLIDNLEKRITNSEIEHLDSKKKEKGYSILDYIVDDINDKHSRYSGSFGRQILIENPECLTDDLWESFYNEVNGEKYESWEILKTSFLQSEKNVRENILNEDVVYNDFNPAYDKFLIEIFDRNFYIQSTEFYNRYYNITTKRFFSSYITFFDGYYKSFAMILKHIDSIEDNSYYIDYLIDNLTTYEKIIIWIAVATRKFGDESRKRILKFEILNGLNSIKGIKPVANQNYYEHILLRLNS